MRIHSLVADPSLPDALYASLPACVIHGDYHPANLKFRGDEVVGIFDLDWATLQPCARDLADGLLFFAARRRTDIDDRDIASLTQAPQIDIERSLVFVDAYLQCGSIENAEIAALPEFMRARWLYCRAAGMAKVEPPRRVAFLLNEIEGPLRWLDEHKEEFTSQLSRLARSRA
ncbi:MAG: phosphotransferase, partial [Armatimonadota bacterium]